MKSWENSSALRLSSRIMFADAVFRKSVALLSCCQLSSWQRKIKKTVVFSSSFKLAQFLEVGHFTVTQSNVRLLISFSSIRLAWISLQRWKANLLRTNAYVFDKYHILSKHLKTMIRPYFNATKFIIKCFSTDNKISSFQQLSSKLEMLIQLTAINLIILSLFYLLIILST